LIESSSRDSHLKGETAGYYSMSGNSRGKSSKFWQISGAGRAFTGAEIENRTAGLNHPGCKNI